MRTVIEPDRPMPRIGKNGITRAPRGDYVAAGLAAFIATLDLMLAPYAIVSLLKVL